MANGNDVLYQPGISFTNPRLVKIAAPVRPNPWFYEQKGVGPLSASSKLRRWDGNTPLKRYSAVWNRDAKARNVAKLGAYFHDVPNMQELGQAPPATSETATTQRDPLGFLNNIVTLADTVGTGVTNVLTQRAVQQQNVAQAQSQSYMARMGAMFGNVGGDYTWLWIAGLGAVGLGAWFYLRK